MGNMLEHIMTNLLDGAMSDWEDADSDYESNGVFRPYWQADHHDTYFWQSSSLSPRGYIFYPKACYDGDT